MNAKEWTIIGVIVGVGGLVLYVRNKNANNSVSQSSAAQDAANQYALLDMLSQMQGAYGSQQSDTSGTNTGVPSDTTLQNLINSILGTGSTSNSDSSGSTNSDSGSSSSSNTFIANPVTAQPVGPEPVLSNVPTSNTPPLSTQGTFLKGIGAQRLMPA